VKENAKKEGDVVRQQGGGSAGKKIATKKMPSVKRKRRKIFEKGWIQKTSARRDRRARGTMRVHKAIKDAAVTRERKWLIEREPEPRGERGRRDGVRGQIEVAVGRHGIDREGRAQREMLVQGDMGRAPS